MSLSDTANRQTRSFIVAIDGPAASGKGTLARRVAEKFGLAHLDTGKLYRATAFLVLEAGGDPADPQQAAAAARRVAPGQLGDPRLLRELVAGAASVVAAIPAVREALLAIQRGFAARPPPPAAARYSTGATSARRSVPTPTSSCSSPPAPRRGRPGGPGSCGSAARRLYTRMSCRT